MVRHQFGLGGAFVPAPQVRPDEIVDFTGGFDKILLIGIDANSSAGSAAAMVSDLFLQEGHRGQRRARRAAAGPFLCTTKAWRIGNGGAINGLAEKF